LSFTSVDPSFLFSTELSSFLRQKAKKENEQIANEQIAFPSPSEPAAELPSPLDG
jgi:hypothetical protein